MYFSNGNIIIIPFKYEFKRYLKDTASVAAKLFSISSIPALLLSLPVAAVLDARDNKVLAEQKLAKIINNHHELCINLKINPNEVIVCNSQLMTELTVSKPEKNVFGMEKHTIVAIHISGLLSVFDILDEYTVVFFVRNKSSVVTKLMQNCGISNFLVGD